MQAPITESVSTDQRRLVEEILGRYSSPLAVLRELIQNSDDARATTVEIRVEASSVIFKNNGNPFSDEDWKRLTTIASGNPNQDSVGRFGVGFYGAFSLTNEPIVESGYRRVRFFWEGPSLKIQRWDLQECVSPTQFVFSLSEAARWTIKEWNRSNISSFLVKTLAFTRHVTKAQVQLLSEPPLQIWKQMEPQGETKLNAPSLSQDNALNFRPLNFLWIRMKMFAKDDVQESHIATLTLVDGEVQVTQSEPFRQHANLLLSKPLPSPTRIKLLSHNYLDGGHVSPLVKDLSPLPDVGKLFVGFATQQQTGTGFHIAASFVPRWNANWSTAAITFIDHGI